MLVRWFGGEEYIPRYDDDQETLVRFEDVPVTDRETAKKVLTEKREEIIACIREGDIESVRTPPMTSTVTSPASVETSSSRLTSSGSIPTVNAKPPISSTR